MTWAILRLLCSDSKPGVILKLVTCSNCLFYSIRGRWGKVSLWRRRRRRIASAAALHHHLLPQLPSPPVPWCCELPSPYTRTPDPWLPPPPRSSPVSLVWLQQRWLREGLTLLPQCGSRPVLWLPLQRFVRSYALLLLIILFQLMVGPHRSCDNLWRSRGIFLNFRNMCCMFSSAVQLKVAPRLYTILIANESHYYVWDNNNTKNVWCFF